MTTDQPPTADRPDGRSLLRGLLAAPVDPWTYRSLAYLLLAFPLAILYFVVLVTGASMTLGLSLTLLGPLAFLATLLSVLGLAWLDAALTDGLLEADVSMGFPETGEGIVAFLRQLLLGRETWLGAVYVLWKTLLGFLAFVGIVVGLSLAASLLIAPLYYGEHVVVGWYQVDTLVRAVLAAGVGVLVGYLTLSLVNLTGHLSAVVAEGLLPGSA